MTACVVGTNCASMFLTVMIMVSIVRQSNTSAARDKHPIILIPGAGGSRAYARLKNDSHASPSQLWLNMKDLLSPERLTELFQLRFDSKLNRSYDNENYEITFPGWGDTYSVEYLDERQHLFGLYFRTLVGALVKDPFFKRNITIRGAPYDFRRTLNENQWFLQALRQLIEDTYTGSGSARVVLVAHSLGSLYVNSFLRMQTPNWKKKHIKAYIAVSSPFGGTMRTPKASASGDILSVFVGNPMAFRNLQRSFPSLPFVAPGLRLWSANETIVIAPKRNYTAHDIEQFFDGIGYTDGYQMMELGKAGQDFFEGPTHVDEVYCIYGTQKPTLEQLIYDSSFPDQNPQVVEGDGDGSVNLRSLEVCRGWKNVKEIIFPGAEHLTILRDKRLIDQIKRVAGFHGG
ncbi:Phosphatidylcholine-sterol acyltransferase (Lecithin-cholesterol acyltransferase)/ Phospholipase A [Paragonimus heterotremus]|uniref:Phosphatidylcholine-sterol acyltransferase (Lecithin-cholesterol acyltransferase)/ Phospholipase A n=1 Tax=Paragonimus heterotremus TaxID=100268 RepID=A0A8J4T711_9TREM|nr:Phosphatidylcholine-sterol acyltransferase (Lecithin-cholesterol acyltransferase)/ Phospholipase A [Paragonimus heterotremus]